MEEQGIMSLPEGRPQIDPSLFDTEIKNIAKSDPKAFKNDLLTSLEEIDPQVVAEFKAELSQMSLSAEVIDALQVMVDEILASPEKYEEIRAKYLAQEVPEELLPAMFDPTFFGGLELALNELEKGSSASPNLESSPLIASPMPMADGGIATVAQAIASMGRRGDTMLAHITPEEAALLQRMGGSGTINPATGLPEFFLKKIFKSAKSVLKGVGKAVNKLAKNDVGRIALTIAASYYMGPAGFNIGASTFSGATLTGVQTAAGNTLVSLAAGDSLKDSLKSGLTAGLTAGFGQAFSSALPKEITNQYIRSGIGGALAGTGVGLARGQNLSEALKSGIGGAAQSAGRQLLMTPFEKLEGKLGSKLPFLDAISESRFAAQPTGTYDPLGNLVKGTGKKISAVGDLFSIEEQDPASIENKSFTPKEAEQAAIMNYRLQNPTLKTLTDQEVLELIRPRSFREKGGEFIEGLRDSTTEFLSPFGESLVNAAGAVVSAPYVGGKYLLDRGGEFIQGFGNPLNTYLSDPNTTAGRFGRNIGKGLQVVGGIPLALGQKVSEGAQDFYKGLTTEGVAEGQRSFAERAGDLTEKGYASTKRLLPTDERRLVLKERILENANKYIKGERTRIANDPNISDKAGALRMAEKTYQKLSAAEPGMVSMYGPAALGLGALAYAGGAFGEEEEAEAEVFDPYYTGMDYIRDNPQLFARRFKSYTPYLYAKGGIAQEFPRKTGPINGPGTGTSDSIPAMLSDGEFVMTAKAVRNMGNGSRRKGAAKMYKMMKELEKRTA